MKHIVRLSVLSALLIGASLPAYCAPSDADMGFASSREPTAADAGLGSVMNVRGFHPLDNTSSPWAGAAQGDQSHYAQTNTDTTWFGPQRETQQYLINLPYRANSQGQSQTKQQAYQAATAGITNGMGGNNASTALMSPNSTSDLSFRGPQNLGFKGSGAMTPFAMKHGFWTRATGTGSVKLSITSANGKD